MKDRTIKPNSYYAASTIIRNQWLPWIKHAITFKNILDTEEGHELYKPVIRRAGKYTYRKVKGSTLLAVIKSADSGELL
jgi:hypothetical protein